MNSKCLMERYFHKKQAVGLGPPHISPAPRADPSLPSQGGAPSRPRPPRGKGLQSCGTPSTAEEVCGSLPRAQMAQTGPWLSGSPEAGFHPPRRRTSETTGRATNMQNELLHKERFLNPKEPCSARLLMARWPTSDLSRVQIKAG